MIDDINFLLEATLNGMPRKSKKTADCPEEYLYWSFLDDESKVEPGLMEHFQKCPFCLGELNSVAQSMTSIPKMDSDKLTKMVAAKLNNYPQIKVKRHSTGILEAIMNSFQLAEGFRSNSHEAIVITEVNPIGKFNIEFLSGTRAGDIEIIIHSSELSSLAHMINADLYQDNDLVRSMAVKPFSRINLSSWPSGQYKLMFRSGDKTVSTIDVTFV